MDYLECLFWLALADIRAGRVCSSAIDALEHALEHAYLSGDNRVRRGHGGREYLTAQFNAGGRLVQVLHWTGVEQTYNVPMSPRGIGGFRALPYENDTLPKWLCMPPV
jgi:hypothetical protein